MVETHWLRGNVAGIVAAILGTIALITWATRIDSYIVESTQTHGALLKIIERLDTITTRLQALEIAKQEKRDWTRILCDEGLPNGLPEGSVRCQWIRGYPR
jgi:hypothetical protein